MTTATVPQMSVTDRCDSCAAQAYIHVLLESGGDLYFCAHHYSKHADALKSVVANVVDESHRLQDA